MGYASDYYAYNPSAVSASGAEGPALGIFLGVIFLLYLVIIGIGIASYIMQALALHDLGKRRNIKNPWLAWIPVLGFGQWIIGSLADEYDARNGIKRKWRVTLLCTILAFFALLIVGYVVLIVGAIMMAIQDEIYGEVMTASAVTTIVVGYIVMMIAAVGSVAFSVCQYICIYKIFESTVPEKAVKYLLLSLLVPLAYPICLLKCRKQGYPEAQMPYQPVISAEAEPLQAQMSYAEKIEPETPVTQENNDEQ